MDFHGALLRNDIPTLKRLARHRNLNEHLGKSGVSPLIYQVQQAARWAQTHHGKCDMSRLDIVRTFLSAKADPNGCDIDGYHALHFCGEPVMAMALLESGARIDARSKHNITPLMWAACNNRLAVVRCLLKRGASVFAGASDGKTALEFAFKDCVEPIRAALARHLASVLAPFVSKDTAGVVIQYFVGSVR